MEGTRDKQAVGVYMAMAAIVAALLAVQTAQEQFSGDVYAHLAVFRELSANPFDPEHPFVAAVDASSFFSPYALAIGLLGKVTSADPLDLLSVGAAINLVLLLTGLWAFSRSFSSYRWTPHLALFFSLVAWGIDSWRWSGYWGLNSIGFGLGYPSMFATGLALLSLASLCRWFSSERRWTVFLIAGAAAVIALSHPFTAMWFAVAVIAITATQAPAVLSDRAPWLLAAGVLVIALALAWPYYSILTLLVRGSESSSIFARLYELVIQRGFLLLPGAAAIVLRARQSVRNPLVWMFIGGVALYAIGWITGLYGLGRVMPLIALSGHVALADLVAGWLASGVRRQTAFAWTTIAVIGTVGLVGSGLGAVRMVPRSLLPQALAADERLDPMVEPYVALREVLTPSDVVLATPWMRRVVPAIEGKLVATWWPVPLLADRAMRERDVEAFFSSNGTDAERDSITARWGATLVVVEPEDLAEFPWLRHSYRVIAETDAYVVFSVE